MADEATGLEARDFEAQHGSGQGRGRMGRGQPRLTSQW